MAIIRNILPKSTLSSTIICIWQIRLPYKSVFVNSQIFKLSLKSFLYTFKGSNCVYELKGDPSPVMLKEIFHDSFGNFNITRICMENHWKRDWMAKVVFLIQMLPTFSGRCNCYFWDIWLKICRLPNFNMLFKLVLTKIFKSELFSCWLKVDHVIKSCKEPNTF